MVAATETPTDPFSETKERLRAERETLEQERYEYGREAGRNWTMETGFEELDNVRIIRTRMKDQWADFLTDNDKKKFFAAEYLAFEIFPEIDGDRTAARAFWEGVFGDSYTLDMHRPFVLSGFVEGALEVYFGATE